MSPETLAVHEFIARHKHAAARFAELLDEVKATPSVPDKIALLEQARGVYAALFPEFLKLPGEAAIFLRPFMRRIAGVLADTDKNIGEYRAILDGARPAAKA